VKGGVEPQYVAEFPKPCTKLDPKASQVPAALVSPLLANLELLDQYFQCGLSNFIEKKGIWLENNGED